MPLPQPEHGLVILFSYLWPDEAATGQEEGVKNRPCVIISATRQEDGTTRILAAPITHSPPDTLADAILLPPGTKQRLGLDNDPAWIKADHINRFTWEDNFDLRRAFDNQWEYGFLPEQLSLDLNALVDQIHTRGDLQQVTRT